MKVQLRKKEPTDVTLSKKQFWKVESMKVTNFSFMLMNLKTKSNLNSSLTAHYWTHISWFFGSDGTWPSLLPIVDKKAIFVNLVLQGEVEGKIFDAFIVVDLHLRGIFIRLEVFDDIREPDRQAIIPGVREGSVTSKDPEEPDCYAVIQNWKSNCGNDGRVKFKTGLFPCTASVHSSSNLCVFLLFFQSFPRPLL